MTEETKLGVNFTFLNFESEKIKNVLSRKGSELSPIPPRLAEEIRGNYNRFLLPLTLSNENGENIRGFTFSREDFEMAVYGETQNIPNAAEKVHLSFGYHDGSTDPDLVGLTLVLYGVASDNSLIDEPNRVRDYSKPCPPDANCPQDAK